MNRIRGAERDALILEIIERIERDTQRIAAPERTAAWEHGWLEALDKFRKDPREESLIPAFVRAGQPLRVDGDLWHGNGASELQYIRALQNGPIADAFKDCTHVYEFGCGTGFNLVALAKLMPGKTYTGLDFSFPAVQLVNEAAQVFQLNLRGAWFNMARPSDMALAGNAGVLTFGAVEQLGGSEAFKPFVEYLIAERPSIVLHIEPAIELYDPANLLDNLAMRFHKKRGYTTGLLPYLQAHPKVEVLSVERAHFGSLMHEGYSRILWRPK